MKPDGWVWEKKYVIYDFKFDKMRKAIILVLLLTASVRPTSAEEGMWIPMLIEQLNFKQMQNLGLRLTAEDIYSINHSSLKDAIVQFGGGCTAEIISPEGLILTNHHCGYGAIQRQSTLEHDYLSDGFWAATQEDEIPAPGLTVSLLVRMEDVTDKVLKGVTEKMNQLQRDGVIRQNIGQLEKEVSKETGYEAKIRPFFYGNQYYLIVSEIFKDIRLVGAPPSSIGKFGGDTDNWMWPRHTGDFSMFRIYADKENKSADYSPENVPYHPKNFLQISTRGYEKGDFTFVFGYPGSTREYLTSYGVETTAFYENPLRIGLRQKRLDIIDQAMASDRLLRIQYSAKAQGIANAWKKMMGETRGIKRLNAIEKKEDFERRFQKWADSLPETRERYGALLSSFKNAYEGYRPVDLALFCITEGGQGVDVVKFAAGFRGLVKAGQDKSTSPETLKSQVESLKKQTRDFFRNYSAIVDRRLLVAMLPEMEKKMDILYQPAIFSEIEKRFGNNVEQYADYVFENTMLTDSTRVLAFLNNFKPATLKRFAADPAYLLACSIYSRQENDLVPTARGYIAVIDSLQRIYMAGQMEMQPAHRFYPDANSSLRIAYGKVDDYKPADAVTYRHFTTLDGVMEKEDTAVYDYKVNPLLKKLYKNKEYGPYADADGTLHVAFTGSNHTTGGNSGSPVLNADGQMIGINFDRNWEGTMSDLMYDPSQCRNITLDIRYCLFIIDKMAGAKRLINEMRIVN
jgi:hypothetical protein